MAKVAQRPGCKRSRLSSFNKENTRAGFPARATATNAGRNYRSLLSRSQVRILPGSPFLWTRSSAVEQAFHQFLSLQAIEISGECLRNYIGKAARRADSNSALSQERRFLKNWSPDRRRAVANAGWNYSAPNSWMVWQVRLLLCDTLSGTSGAIRVSPILVATVRLHKCIFAKCKTCPLASVKGQL